MNRVEILQQLEVIFKDIFDDEDIILEETTSADDIDDWDSLTHIQLVVAIEKKFKIKFGTKELLLWKNVGEMLEAILSKLG